MQIPARGIGRDEILTTMRSYRDRDVQWRDGRTWAYVYDAGPEVERIAHEAYLMYLSDNGLDPTVFPSLLRFENEVVEMARNHLRGGPDVVGNFTSGGTESCMLAVKTARDFARAERGIDRPQMVVPVTAHAAFHKAAAYFDVELVHVPVQGGDYRVHGQAMADAINDRTILLVASAPSYAHGCVDPIRELGALALEHELLLHVDACIGGVLLPLFRELGEPVPDFDLSVPGVSSISMDLHKYGFTPKGASVVLYRDRHLRKHQIFSCADWTGYTVVNPTMLSTKSGGPVAAAWAVMRFLGREGYLELARTMLEGKKRILAGLAAMDDLFVLGEPDINLVAFSSETISVFHLADEMKQRGWYIQPQLGFHGSRANIHLSINPHCVQWVADLLADLAACIDVVKAMPPDDTLQTLGPMLSALDPTTLDEAAFGRILGMAGITGVQLPERMADINHLLDAMPPQFTEVMLLEFLNQLFQYRKE